MATTEIPGYVTVRDIATRLGVTDGRVRQLVQEMKESQSDLGFLVGTTRVFTSSEAKAIERLHNNKRHYHKQ